MKGFKIAFVVAAMAALILAGGIAFSQGSMSKGSMHNEGMQKEGMHEHMKGEGMGMHWKDVTITGQNFCVCYHLTKEKGLDIDCSNQNALMVEDMEYGDEDMEEGMHHGMVLHYMKTPAAEELLKKDNMGKKVEIKGMIFPRLHVIKVDSAKILGEGSGMKGSSKKGSMMKDSEKK